MKTTYLTHTRGQSLVELALLLPVLLLLTVVTLDLGRGVYYYSVIYNAAREGARYAIIDPDDFAGIEAAVKDLAIGLDQSEMTVSTLLPTEDTIQVTVEYNFELVTPIARLFTSDIHLESSSTMMIEH